MPDPFNKTKMSGDTHPPELESDLPLEEGSANAAGVSGAPTDRGMAVDRGDQERPGRGARKAGLKDNDHSEAGQGGHSER